MIYLSCRICYTNDVCCAFSIKQINNKLDRNDSSYYQWITRDFIAQCSKYVLKAPQQHWNWKPRQQSQQNAINIWINTNCCIEQLLVISLHSSTKCTTHTHTHTCITWIQLHCKWEQWSYSQTINNVNKWSQLQQLLYAEHTRKIQILSALVSIQKLQSHSSVQAEVEIYNGTFMSTFIYK